jgi:hypothetical protein
MVQVAGGIHCPINMRKFDHPDYSLRGSTICEFETNRVTSYLALIGVSHKLNVITEFEMHTMFVIRWANSKQRWFT